MLALSGRYASNQRSQQFGWWWYSSKYFDRMSLWSQFTAYFDACLIALAWNLSDEHDLGRRCRLCLSMSYCQREFVSVQFPDNRPSWYILVPFSSGWVPLILLENYEPDLVPETQYCDGIRGPLVIYDDNDPHASLYDVDDGQSICSHSRVYVNWRCAWNVRVYRP